MSRFPTSPPRGSMRSLPLTGLLGTLHRPEDKSADRTALGSRYGPRVSSSRRSAAPPAVPDVTRIYPGPHEQVQIEGCYLALDLRRYARDDRAFVYSNFVVSLDGRISITSGENGEAGGVPEELHNERDWRLYQELAAQTDVIITSGRYLRELVAGDAGPLLTYPADPDLAYLLDYRASLGLPDRPAIAVISASLDFAIAGLTGLGSEACVLTTPAASQQRVALFAEQGITVRVAPEPGRLRGAWIATELLGLGYSMAFSAAGPALLRTLLDGEALDALFVTQVMTMLGGDRVVPMMTGPRLTPPTSFQIEHVYVDEHGPAGATQMFSFFRPDQRAECTPRDQTQPAQLDQDR